jgi:predicted CoA-binding protein
MMADTPRFDNPSDSTIRGIITGMKRVAVVGISAKEDRASNGIARWLKGLGLEVVGVNPVLDQPVHDIAIYPSLEDVPGTVDVVDVFRRPDTIAPVIDAAISRGDRCVWLQEQVVNDAEAQRAAGAGLDVVMNLCLYKEWLRLVNARDEAPEKHGAGD